MINLQSRMSNVDFNKEMKEKNQYWQNDNQLVSSFRYIDKVCESPQ